MNRLVYGSTNETFQYMSYKHSSFGGCCCCCLASPTVVVGYPSPSQQPLALLKRPAIPLSEAVPDISLR